MKNEQVINQFRIKMGLTLFMISLNTSMGLADGTIPRPRPPSVKSEEVREPTGNFPADQYMKIAAIQFSPSQDAPVDVSQDEINTYKAKTSNELEKEIVEAAHHGAKLIVTPEFGLVGYPDIPNLPPEEDEFQSPEQIMPYAEPLTGKSVVHFAALAKKLNIYLVIGIAELDGTTKKIYNTLVAINPDGKIQESYRKINLFEGETHFLSAGTHRKFFETPVGRVGFATCFDIHFANPTDDLATKDGIKALAFATSWVGKNGMDTFTATAKKLNIYLIAANHVYFPDSGVINPDGKTQSHIRKLNGPAYGYIKLK